MIVFLEFHEFSLEYDFNVLNKAFLLVKWVIVVFNNRTWSEVKNELFSNQLLGADRPFEQSFQEKIAYSSINKVFLFPRQFNKHFFVRHIKLQQPLDEFGSFHVVLKPLVVPKNSIVLKKLQKNVEVPFSKILDFELLHFRCYNFCIQLHLIEEHIVFVIESSQI